MEEGGLTDRRDIVEVINTGLINQIEYMVTSTDSEISSPTTTGICVYTNRREHKS